MNLAKHIIGVMLSNNNDEQIHYRGKKIGAEEIAARSLSMATKLKEQHFMPDQRVLLVMKDSPSFVYSFTALMSIGCIPVPLNPKIEDHVMGHILADSRAAGVVIDIEEYERLKSTIAASDYLPAANRFINDQSGDIFQEDGTKISYTLPITVCHADFLYYEKKPVSSSFWQYTSGTTGMPKAVQHSQETMLLNTNSFAVETLGINKTDRVMSVPKMFFGYGLGNSFFFPLLTGASVLLDPEWPSLTQVITNINYFKPTVFFGVPKTYSMLLQNKKDITLDTQSIRLFFSAGSNLPEGINKDWYQWKGKHIVNGIGSTEIGHVYICNRPESVSPGVSGWRVAGYQVRIADLADNQKEAAIGATGEICIQPPYYLGKYWENITSNDRHFKNEWYYSGDLGIKTNDEGFIYQGRKDDLFKINGRWVNPSEIETIALQLFDIDECALVEVNDENDLSMAILFIVKRANAQVHEDVIKEVLRGQVSSYKCPQQICTIDQLPKNANGKINRSVIKTMYNSMFRKVVQ